MGGSADPRNPQQLRSGLAAANQLPTSDVGRISATCPNNWVEAGAIDETSGKPLPGLGYRIYDIATGDRVASGTLDAEGKSPRHKIPTPITQLYAVFGTEKAMDKAEEELGGIRQKQALQTNAVQDWRGIPSGLNEEQFNQAYDDQVRANGGRWEKPSVGLLEGAGYGANMAYDYVSSGFDSDYMLNELYTDDRRRNFEEYELATNARQASNGESFVGGAGQGVTFGFGEEAMAGLASLFSDRSYEELVEERRQLQRAQQIANPNFYMGGEIAGAVPTIFVPVGGAAGRAAQAGKGISGAVRAGATTGAATGAISGAGHDEGGLVDRLDGAAIGAVTGGVAGAVMSGAGVLIARGVSKTRIWARITGRPRPGSLDNKAAREWYLEQEKLIPERLDPNASLEAQARQAHALRNEARTTARELMSDRNLAAELTKSNPNLSWDQIVEKTAGKGFEGDDVFREIISSSQRSRTSVNQKLGL